MRSDFRLKLLAPGALLVLAGCSISMTDGDGVVLSGTQVETGAPGELFIWNPNTNPFMKCVSKEMDETGIGSSSLVEFPIVQGGILRGKGGWKATFTQPNLRQTRVVIADKNGNVDPELTAKMRGWMDACAGAQ